MTSRHPAVSCACPKCQSERRTTPPPATEEREAAFNAAIIGLNWDKNPALVANARQLFGNSLNNSCGALSDYMAGRFIDAFRAAAAALSALAPVRAQEIAAARAEEQGYRHTQVAALKQVHAAEILAAEANERARALGQAAEHINRLEAALRGLLSTVERLDISEGVCCCGDDMATHAEPMSCGHTPVDAGHYHHGNAIQQARDAIEHGAGK